MKRLYSFLIALVLVTGAYAQQPERQLPGPAPFHEEVGSKGTQAPVNSVRQLREFIRYVFREKPNIATDADAQQRYLSKPLREAFNHRQKLYADFVKNNETPDGPPGNIDFVGSWDYPTSFRIVGSRAYKERAVIDVLFTWGKHTNYEGDTRLTSYSLIQEDGRWKLEDIYTFNGKFIPAGSLLQEFRRKTYY